MRYPVPFILAAFLGCGESGPGTDTPPIDALDTAVAVECTWGISLDGMYSVDCGGGAAGSCIDSVYWWALKSSDEKTRALLTNCGQDSAAITACGSAPTLAPLPATEWSGGACISCDGWPAYVASIDAVRTWARCVADKCPNGVCQ